jgi:hypothetical protein
LLSSKALPHHGGGPQFLAVILELVLRDITLVISP